VDAQVPADREHDRPGRWDDTRPDTDPADVEASTVRLGDVRVALDDENALDLGRRRG